MQEGDLVTLKTADSPIMVIESFQTGERIAKCVWWNPWSKEIRHEQIYIGGLKEYVPPKPDNGRTLKVGVKR